MKYNKKKHLTKPKYFYIKPPILVEEINDYFIDDYISTTLELIIISGIGYIVYNLLSPK